MVRLKVELGHPHQLDRWPDEVEPCFSVKGETPTQRLMFTLGHILSK